MKRIIASILLFLLVISPVLYASISFSDDIDEADRAFLLSSFEGGIGKRGDAQIDIISFSRDDARLLLVFEIEGEMRSISASNEQEMRSFIENALSMEELLYMEESTLFYVTDDIIASHDDYHVGKLVEAYDSEGRTRALLEVTDRDDGINLYTSIYKKDLMAGLALRSGPSFSLSIRALSNFSFSSFGFAVDLAYLPLFSYFNPVASFYLSYDGSLSYYGGLGIEARLPLNRLINTRFTLIEDASIIASAMIYLGYDGALSFGSSFLVAYEHHISSRTFWRLGYETGTIMANAAMLSFGVMF